MGPFREAYQFSEGIAAVLALDKKGYGPFWGFISRSGAWIAEPDYEEVSAFRNGRASVLVYDYVSKDGRVVLDGRLPKLKEYWAFVDRSGKVITKSEYSECRDFDESGHALVKYEGKWGIIDLNGNTVIPTKYHELLPFFEDAQFTVARINRKYGFISKDGRELTEFKYDDVDRKPSSRKVKRVKLNNLYCMVDVNGDEVVPLKYEMCYYLENQDKFVWVELGDNKRRFFNLETREEFGPTFSNQLELEYEGLMVIKIDGKLAIYDLNQQKEIVPTPI
jgi:KWG Leptospira.